MQDAVLKGADIDDNVLAAVVVFICSSWLLTLPNINHNLYMTETVMKANSNAQGGHVLQIPK